MEKVVSYPRLLFFYLFSYFQASFFRTSSATADPGE